MVLRVYKKQLKPLGLGGVGGLAYGVGPRVPGLGRMVGGLGGGQGYVYVSI